MFLFALFSHSFELSKCICFTFYSLPFAVSHRGIFVFIVWWMNFEQQYQKSKIILMLLFDRYIGTLRVNYVSFTDQSGYSNNFKVGFGGLRPSLKKGHHLFWLVPSIRTVAPSNSVWVFWFQTRSVIKPLKLKSYRPLSILYQFSFLMWKIQGLELYILTRCWIYALNIRKALHHKKIWIVTNHTQ